jgi:hypothetical protein
MPESQKLKIQPQGAPVFSDPTRSRKVTKNGMVPICSWCKKIRDVDGNWLTIEAFLHKYFGMVCTHTICEDCRDQHYPECSETRSCG